MHLAARHNSAAIVELLVNEGASVDLRNGDGDAPLHVAVRKNLAEMSRVLLCRGADVHVRNYFGEHPHDYAREHHKIGALFVLEDYSKTLFSSV